MAAITEALIAAVRELGLDCLPWSPTALSLRSRVAVLAALDGSEAGWPALGDGALLETLETWLKPYLAGIRTLGQLQKLDLVEILFGGLSWGQRQDLDARAPTHFTAPSGSRLPIDYSGEAPVLSVRVQELFGLTEHPTIANGRVPLLLSLLSPANRPIQLTRDLPGFWAGSYKAVRADLRGRYPKHPWPDDPVQAQPTARAKPRGT
jgi:ATP-dependent helicase HrpB